jgi:endonuclease
MSMAQATTFSEALKQCLVALSGVRSRSEIENWIEKNYPKKWKPGTLVGHLYGCSVNNPKGIQHHPSFPRFIFAHGNGRYELYDSARHGHYENGVPVGEDAQIVFAPNLEPSIQAIENSFAYEAHLRDYLARNLQLLEPGLSFWDTNTEIEYPVDGRRIDILAKDSTGLPIVIELKVSKGHERTIGQCLFYRGKLKQMFNAPRVRIFIVAEEISAELRIACAELLDVTLFEYSLSMTVRKIVEAKFAKA